MDGGSAPDVESGMQRGPLEGAVAVSHRVVPWDEDLKHKRPLKHSKMDDPRWGGPPRWSGAWQMRRLQERATRPATRLSMAALFAPRLGGRAGQQRQPRTALHSNRHRLHTHALPAPLHTCAPPCTPIPTRPPLAGSLPSLSRASRRESTW
jgi:hypothetical protein